MLSTIIYVIVRDRGDHSKVVGLKNLSKTNKRGFCHLSRICAPSFTTPINITKQSPLSIRSNAVNMLNETA